MASINDKLRKYKSLFSTTLSTGIGTGTSDTITPATVTGLPTDTAITLTIDRVDSSGTATPSKLERIKGIISGGNLIDYVRGVDGTTEQAHSAGAVVEMVWNAADWNDMVDWGLVEHSQLGVHDKTKVVDLTTAQTLTNKTLTSPVINTPTGDVATITGAQTLTNKTLTSPKINEDVAVTATATELNYVDGVTSAIQTQFAGKQADLKLTLLASGKVTDTTNGVTISSIGSSGIYLVFTEGWAGVTDGKTGFAICSNISSNYSYVNTILGGTYSGTVTMPSHTSIKIVPHSIDGAQYLILRLNVW